MPTIDLVIAYSNLNTSPILKLFLSRTGRFDSPCVAKNPLMRERLVDDMRVGGTSVVVWAQACGDRDDGARDPEALLLIWRSTLTGLLNETYHVFYVICEWILIWS